MRGRPVDSSEMLPWVDYSGQAPRELVALADTHRLDSIVTAFGTALLEKEERSGVDSLSDVERTVYAVYWLETEINNGGFVQFFSNSSLQFTPFIVQALLDVGLPKTAVITKNAIAALELPDDFSLDDVFVSALADDEDKEFLLSEADTQFFEYEEDISGVLFEYIRVHIDKIQF